MSQPKRKTTILRPNQIKEEYPNIYSIFFEEIPQKETFTREDNETLHDYFIRNNWRCFCHQCKQTKLL